MTVHQFPVKGKVKMNTLYTDTRVSGENITLDDYTEVSVVLRSFLSGCTEVAITLVSYYPEFGKLGGELYSDVELSPEHARWLAADLLRAAESCGDGTEEST